MKKIVLVMLTLFLMAPVQAQLVHDAKSIVVDVLSKAKQLVFAHPYATATIATTALVVGYWLNKSDDDECEDPSYEKLKNYFTRKPVSPVTVSPTVSPSHSSDTLQDFTGDFPNTRSQTLHPYKLRHN